MAQQITLVTTNPDKVGAITAHLARFGIEVRHLHAALIEPQADTVEEVARIKALEAFKLANAPVIIDDTGFSIDALGGFPGPYTKYVLRTIGIEGLLSLVQPHHSRRCRFVNALVYVDASGRLSSFVEQDGQGLLADFADQTPCPEAWSALWRIFIPDGYDKPLSAMLPDERARLWEAWAAHSVYARFGRWLQDQLD
ncbi:MAG: non-canonical purine NTP pyrophosphatase [Chloroflexota bacterium]|nr:MAG: xanthosine triphosphate pyrophosphatase [Chloroflexota bacterium]